MALQEGALFGSTSEPTTPHCAPTTPAWGSCWGLPAALSSPACNLPVKPPCRFMLFFGLSMAASVRISNSLGAGCPQAARRATFATLALSLVALTALLTALLMLRVSGSGLGLTTACRTLQNAQPLRPSLARPKRCPLLLPLLLPCWPHRGAGCGC